MLTHYYDLDVVPGSVPLIVHCSQYDKGSRTLVFNLYSSAGDFIIPPGTLAEIKGTKPDGNGFSYSCTIANNEVSMDVTEQMTAVAGRATCELVLTNASGDQQMATANFLLSVERAALDKDTLQSGSEIRELIDIVDRTDEIIAAANKADSAKNEIARLTNTATEAARGAKASEGHASEILQEVNDKAQQIATVKTEADAIASKALEAATNAENEVANNQNELASLKEKDNEILLALEGYVDGGYVENGVAYFTHNGDTLFEITGIGGGSGGGGGTGGNNASLTVTNTTGWLSRTIAAGDKCEVSFTWTSIEDEMPTGNGTERIMVNGVVRAILDISQGPVTTDVSAYLSAGSNIVRVTISDVYGNNRAINFTITTVELSINSSFDASIPYTGPFIFPFTPVGAVQKTVYFILDGKEIGTTQTAVSGRQQSFMVAQQKHGVHTFRCYFEAVINGQIVRSNELYYEIICLETLNMTPVIASSFHETEVDQYTSLHINYTVYDPSKMTADIVIEVNGRQVSAQTVDRSAQVFTYRADDVGELTITIKTGEVSKTFNLNVLESSIDVEAETDSLVLYLSSYGRSNNEEAPGTWKYGSIAAKMSGFNYTSDGWQMDDEHTTVLRVSGDARVQIPYKIFGTDCRTTGKTVEIEFSTSDVMNYDSVIFSCMSGGRGIEMTAQKVSLKSEQSEISMQFKEEEHVRVAFVIEKRSENRLIYCYINGIMSGAVQYPADDDFAQTSPADISIGSNDCTINLYCIRVYDNNLNRNQILDNWIADTQTIEDMLARYQRNSVYDEYGNIVIAQLPGDLPYLIIETEELPQYKGDKKTVSGSYVNPVNMERSFSFTGAQFDVQGTSSQYYKRKNYKGKFKKGFLMNSGAAAESYPIRSTGAVPTATFCFKADVASSEGANNVELVRLYNESCPYKTPAQEGDSRIRQGIDGFPIVIFWNNPQTGETVFLGKYNFNNDKGTPEVFGFSGDDESWEVLNNTSDRVLWKSADFSGDAWLSDFEARYPDTDPAYTDSTQLAQFAAWCASTDTSAATGAALPAAVTYDGAQYTSDTAEYRLAKFKAEIGNYVEVDSALFYYLFTETFLMVDSRAKNMFPSMIGGRSSV